MTRLSVVVPTYNEAENIVPLLRGLRDALASIPHEVLVVDDDSPDRTWAVAEEYARSAGGAVRVVRRLREKGLSASVAEGFSLARGEYLGVMDADLSHDASLVPRLLAAVKGGAELAVGFRRVPGGGADKWPWRRRGASTLATLFAKALLGVPLRDPMSGFFVMRRGLYDRCRERLHPRGYKILLELVVRSGVPPGKVVELPYVFKDRRQGYSKLSAAVARAFLLQCADLFFSKRFGRSAERPPKYL